MATRENQSMQIALMVFALMVVLLAVTTYVGFKSYGDQRKQNDSLKSELNESRRVERDTQNEANRFKDMMGYPPEDKLPSVEESFAEDMQDYAPAFPDDQQRYRLVLEYLANEIVAITEREVTFRDTAQSLKNVLANVQRDAAEQVAKYREEMESIKADAAAEREKFLRERGRLEQEGQALAQRLQERDQTIARLSAKLEEQENHFNSQIASLERRNTRLAREKQELVDDSFEAEDGQILRVNQGSRTVWINLGRQERLMPRVTFSVFDWDQSNATSAVKKARIEVTRILGSHLAEARILKDDIANPIVSKDKIYSPLWQRGRSESYALAGFFDIDGDGKDDLERMKELAKINGAIVDAYIGDDGKMVGEITVDTRYLVSGEEPKVAAGKNLEVGAIHDALATYGNMHHDAEHLGVRLLSADKFLDRLGWQLEERTVPVGPGAVSRDFRVRPKDGDPRRPKQSAAEKFRKRRSPLNGR